MRKVELIDKNELLTITDVRTDGTEVIYVPYNEIEQAPTIQAIPLDKVKQAKEKIEKLRDEEIITDQRSEAPMEQYITEVGEGLELALDVLDELIESEDE